MLTAIKMCFSQLQSKELEQTLDKFVRFHLAFFAILALPACLAALVVMVEGLYWWAVLPLSLFLIFATCLLWTMALYWIETMSQSAISKKTMLSLLIGGYAVVFIFYAIVWLIFPSKEALTYTSCLALLAFLNWGGVVVKDAACSIGMRYN